MRSNILAAARRLFASHGIHVSGVDLISAEAGVSKMTLYKYFRSKDRLVLEYIDLIGREQLAQWRSAFAGQTADQAVERLFQLAVQALQDGARARPLLCAAMELGDAQREALSQILELEEHLRLLLEDVATQTGAQDPRELSYMMLNLYNGAVINAWLEAFPEPLLRAQRLARTLLQAAPKK